MQSRLCDRLAVTFSMLYICCLQNPQWNISTPPFLLELSEPSSVHPHPLINICVTAAAVVAVTLREEKHQRALVHGRTPRQVESIMIIFPSKEHPCLTPITCNYTVRKQHLRRDRAALWEMSSALAAAGAELGSDWLDKESNGKVLFIFETRMAFYT